VVFSKGNKWAEKYNNLAYVIQLHREQN
jgi:hypothetical protein